jgi:WD40 repeat protein
VFAHQPVGQPLTGFKYTVTSVTFSPDGKLIASASMDGSIIVWDVDTHQPVGEPLTMEAPPSVALSPDGKMLASGSYDESIILSDVNTHQPITQLWGDKNYVMSVAFSPDGKTLA